MRNSKYLILATTFLLFNGVNSYANDKALFTCPASPNCASTEASKKDSAHYVAPFKTIDGSEAIWKKIRETVLSLPRTKIIEENGFYFKAEVTSFVFRFVDELDVSFCPETKILSVKSSSRVGYSDFGVNKKRVEGLRTLLSDQNILSINPGLKHE